MAAPAWRTTRLLHGIRAIVGGQAQPGSNRPPVVLLAGWPQTAEAFSGLFEPLSQRYRFLALDPPGLGESTPPPSYDTASVSKLLAEAIHDALQDDNTNSSNDHVPPSYHLIGHDVGAWLAYPWAAQFPSRIASLSLLDGLVPGFQPPMAFPLPPATNQRLWQFSFLALPDLPELLTRGRERALLTWFFDRKTVDPAAFRQDRHFERYLATYARPGALSRSFEYYRAFDESARQNGELAKTGALEAVPVLALGGASSVGVGMVELVRKFAPHAVGGAIEACGHFLPEEQPRAVAERLLEFWEEADASR